MASQVYFQSGGVGDIYYATQATLPGESPDSAAQKWARIEIPARARAYLRLSAAGHVRRANGEPEAAMALLAMANRELQETMRLAARERKSFTLPVRVPL
jgi:hypothetical protein